MDSAQNMNFDYFKHIGSKKLIEYYMLLQIIGQGYMFFSQETAKGVM